MSSSVVTGSRSELSWSKSRDGVLADCPRKYWFQYYGSWGGWDPAAEPRTRQIYLLKQLRSRHMWAGEIVHGVIEGLLRAYRDGAAPPPLAELRAGVRADMREAFRASRERRFRHEERPSSLALFEHDYERPVSPGEWRQIADQVDLCLERFFATGTWARILRMDPARDWLELEQLEGFELDGVRVHVKLDFAHRDGADAVVVDWKTGKSNGDNRFQFGCYVLYAVGKWKLPPERVRGLEVNLATGVEKEHRFDAGELERVEGDVRRSIARMRELLRDPDANLAVEADFPLRPGRWRCQNCNFLRVCPEGESLELLEQAAGAMTQRFVR